LTETRITNPTTGGQKGQKPEQMSLLPVEALEAVSRVYGFGADKYDRDNWRKGYDWHLSYDALQRHLQSFWKGEDIDPESGEPHLAHAVFHCFTLLTFMESYPEGDDRPETPKANGLPTPIIPGDGWSSHVPPAGRWQFATSPFTADL
jgi:hypothetical protein